VALDPHPAAAPAATAVAVPADDGAAELLLPLLMLTLGPLRFFSSSASVFLAEEEDDDEDFDDDLPPLAAWLTPGRAARHIPSTAIRALWRKADIGWSPLLNGRYAAMITLAAHLSSRMPGCHPGRE